MLEDLLGFKSTLKRGRSRKPNTFSNGTIILLAKFQKHLHFPKPGHFELHANGQLKTEEIYISNSKTIKVSITVRTLFINTS